MAETFRALRVHKAEGGQESRFEDLTLDDLMDGDVVVRVDPRYYRPAEVSTLLGNPAKATSELGWLPKIGITELVAEMAASDLERAGRLALLRRHGYDIPAPAGL